MENCKLIIVYFFVVLILAITIIAQKDISHQQEMEASLDHIDSLENIIKLKEYTNFLHFFTKKIKQKKEMSKFTISKFQNFSVLLKQIKISTTKTNKESKFKFHDFKLINFVL